MTMATKNFDVSTDWVLIANTADATLMISSRNRTRLEVATTAADEAPGTVLGHVVSMGGDSRLTRADGLVGYVHCRVVAGHPDAVLAVDGSSVTDPE
jgi:hypothetical protein